LIFTVTPKSEDLFAPLEGCLCLLGVVIIVLPTFLAQYYELSIVYIFNFPVEIPFGRPKSIAKQALIYSLSYDISCLCFFHHEVLVALLDGCTVGTT
jgi:hypothetical protein